MWKLILVRPIRSHVARTEVDASSCSRVRILIVCRELPPVGGGAGSVARNLALCLGQRSHDVDLLTMRYDSAVEHHKQPSSLNVYTVSVGRRRQDRASSFEMARFVWSGWARLADLSARRDYEVLHAHAIVPDGLLLPASKLPARRVMTAHGSDVPGYNPDNYRVAHRLIRPLWKRATRHPHVLTTPSAHLRSLILAAGGPQSTVVVPNGIDTDLFDPEPKTRSFLVVARLVPRKNTHLLLEALRRLDEPATVDIVGDGPERPRLESLASSLQHHTVNFHGWLPHGSPAWRALYQRSRFFVFLSLSENFPINLLEAQLARMVVLASDIPGNREALGHTARYVTELSVEKVAHALRDLQHTPDQRLDVEGEEARQRVLDHFSWERVAESFEQLYSGLNTRGESGPT